MTDESNGYEDIAETYIKLRGRSINGIGSSTVRVWAKNFTKNAVVLDTGCGTGIPVTQILLDEGLIPHALDASPTMIKEFKQNFPNVPAACESVEQSALFNRSFDGIIAVGLIFLLSENSQRTMIQKIALTLNAGGRFLFTAPLSRVEWKDTLTGRKSRSLGGDEYKTLLSASGLSVAEEWEDEGENHYFNAIRPRQ